MNGTCASSAPETIRGFTETAALAAGDGLLRTEGMITHRFRLEDFRTALSSETLSHPGFIKAVFTF